MVHTDASERRPAALPPSPLPNLQRFVLGYAQTPTNFPYPERIWWQTAFLLIGSIPIALLALTLDARLHNDIAIWIKPLKFQVSLALHLVTLAVLVRMLSVAARTSSWMAGLALSSSAAALIEIVLIGGQASRGVGSHFNTDAPLDNVIYAIMGVGSLILIVPALVIGVRFLATKPSERLHPVMKLAVSSGLLLSFILTLTVAGYMSMQSGHWVDAPPTDANGVPIVGWTRQGGDLRVAHFFATHLMQAVPLVGWLALMIFPTRRNLQLFLVGAASFAGTALALGTFFQALSGQPFIGVWS